MSKQVVATMVMGASALGAVGPAFADDIMANSRVTAVTVFPSGAEVTRTAKVKLVQGTHTVFFSDLPAQAIAASIRVEGKATERLDIGSVDTRRTSVSHLDAANVASERRRIETEIEKLRDQRMVFDGKKQAAESQKALIQNLTQLPVRPPPMLTQNSNGENWPQVLALISSSTADAQTALLEATVNLRETDRKIQDLERKLAETVPQRNESTEVKVNITAPQSADAELVVRYQVPSASWSALYDARLATGTKSVAPKLELIRRASITQRSGEAWTNAAISLSTTRPTASSAAPELRPITVDYVPEPKPRPTSASPQIMDGMGRLAAGAPPPPVAEMEAEADLQRARSAAKTVTAQDVRAEVVSAPFQAIFQVPGLLTVAETGEVKRVQLTADTLEPALSVRTVPKRDQKAYLYAKLQLPKGAPLVAGPVSLFRDGTFVGTGRLPLLSPAEEHELGFGADDLIRVKYAVSDEKKGETGLISSAKTDAKSYKITLKSLHERAIPFTVIDQMPVSLQQDIRVDLAARPAPTRQNVEDKRGVLAWDGELKPDEEKLIEHGYRVTWPGAKPIQTR